MEEIELGKVFANPDVRRDGYILRKLILRNKRAIGCWSYGRYGTMTGFYGCEIIQAITHLISA